MLDAPVSGGAAKSGKQGISRFMASRFAREAFEIAPRAQCRRWQGLRDRPGNRAGSNRQDHPSIAGRRTYCSRCRSNGACRRSGIPLDIMYDVVTHAAGNSWMFENRMKHVVDGDYTPKSAVDIFVKDLRLVTETGLSMDFPLPLATTAYSLFANASNAGFGKKMMPPLSRHMPASNFPTGVHDMRLGVIARRFYRSNRYRRISGWQRPAHHSAEWRSSGRPCRGCGCGRHQPEDPFLPDRASNCRKPRGAEMAAKSNCQQFFFKYCSTFDNYAKKAISGLSPMHLARHWVKNSPSSALPCPSMAVPSIMAICL